MPTTPKDDEQPPKKGRKKPAPAAAPAESYLTGSEPELEPNTIRPAADDRTDEIREGAAKLSAMMSLLGYEDKAQKRSQPLLAKEPRQDAEKNRAKIRAVMLRYIKNECRAPSVQEICDATGLSDKTVKAHRKHIKLGDGSANMYQQLTHDVIMSIYKKTRGYSYDSEKLLVVSGGKDMGSEVERHPIVMHVQPDMSAAKLWLQAIEGMSDKSETKHSGNVGGGSFHFEYVAPAGAAAADE